MTKEELQQLSDETFIDNNAKLIQPAVHRNFNNKLIGFIPEKLSDMATFVVDSDAALAQWANNDPGNDYSVVLIETGTWTVQQTIDLGAAGTKSVIGKIGSKLLITAEYGFKYSSAPVGSDYCMFGVSISVTGKYGFYRCTNLYNCNGYISDSGTTYSIHVFYECLNLILCTGTCDELLNRTPFKKCTKLISCRNTQITNSYGFSECSELVTCEGIGEVGFVDCINLQACTVNITESKNNLIGFLRCLNMSNCSAVINNAGGYSYGFYLCKNLSGCTGKINASYYGYAFFNCIGLSLCTGQGVGVPAGYGFIECRVLFGCYPLAASSTATYSYCYMNVSTNTNLVADTAAGGYNRS